MISTLEVAPSPMLQPYVKSFSLREFDTSENEMKMPLHAIHEIYLSFFLNEKLPVMHNLPSISDEANIFGLHTFCRGVAQIFKGHFRMFCILFKPNGFVRLFNTSPSEFTDKIISGSDLFSTPINRLQMQLQESKKFTQMVGYTEQFLLAYLSKSKTKDPYNRIQSASCFLLQHSSNASIKWLAYQSNMSIKTFERTFTTQVGIAPKLFGRIARFNTALNLKLIHPKWDWTAIAHHCGYFDQMHFIKDFKAFAGEAPSRFFKTSPPPKKDLQNNNYAPEGW